MATSIAQKERQALAALLEDEGPLAPTLCEGWATSDLAAHLYVREHRPIAAAGILVPPLARLTEHAMESAKRELGYAKLVSAVRSGPPFPWTLLDSAMNVAEYFVHHEDVRRAGGDAEPRVDADLDEALWRVLRRSAVLLSLRLRGLGLEIAAPSFGRFTASQAKPHVLLEGGPQELVLFLFGRKAVARVRIEGSEEARERLMKAKLAF